MLSREAKSSRYLYDYSSLSKVPYSDYLREKEFELSIRYAIDNQTKELIASNEQLSESGLQILGENLDQGFTAISESIEYLASAVEQGTEEIVSAVLCSGSKIVRALNWGFTEVLVSLGQMSINLAELIKLTRTPSQTWACEQFEIARDEFRRQLYSEALESVTRAIEGLGSNPGVKTEFRFHFLAGTIRLGSYKNSSPEVVNPKLAEQEFLAAARYATTDYPMDAAQAFICAARAALVQGRIGAAIEHARKGLSFDPTHIAGLYVLARALFLKGDLREATDRLADAICLDEKQALHAGADPDFTTNKIFLSNAITQAVDRYHKRCSRLVERYCKAVDVLENYSFAGISAGEQVLKGVAEARKTFESAMGKAATKTVFGYRAAIEQMTGGFQHFPGYFAEYKKEFINHHQNEIISKTPAVFNPDPIMDPALSPAWGVFGVIGALIVFQYYENRPEAQQYHNLLFLFNVIVPGLFYAVLSGAALAALAVLIEFTVNRIDRRRIQAANDAGKKAHLSEVANFNRLHALLKKEISDVDALNLPEECELPSSLRTGI